MDIKEEDFPFYQLLINQPSPGTQIFGINAAIRGFKKAINGSDDDKYNFVLGIQTPLTQMDYLSIDLIPGLTEEIRKKTLESCYKIFKTLAERGHNSSIFMVRHYSEQNLVEGI